ncbi:ABC transporter permease [Dysosmobacter sp.]
MSDLLISTLTQGLIYALISFGVYITYSILDFPDLGVDGTFPLGAAVTAALLTRGADPWLTLAAALAVGALSGLFTGLVHVCLKVRNLLAGIITMTALFSVNLQIAGSNLTVDRSVDTIFTSAPVMALLGNLSLMERKLVVSLLLVIAVKLLLDLYFRTKSGLLLRAVGDNADLVTTLAKNRGAVKILGLVLSNALVALAGCVVCHEQRSFSATMGTGQLVYGLAAVIIGISLMNFYTGSPLARTLHAVPGLQAFSAPRGTTAVVLGSILYKMCIQTALSMGLPANMMKLITAVLFLLVLVLSGRKGEAIIHA